MKNTFICPYCGKEAETNVIEKKETLSVKGKPITLMVEVRICQHCKEELVDPTLDQKTILAFYDAYRKSENLLTSAEICEIRKSYNLSQSSFSKLLGFGEWRYSRCLSRQNPSACEKSKRFLSALVHVQRRTLRTRKCEDFSIADILVLSLSFCTRVLLRRKRFFC